MQTMDATPAATVVILRDHADGIEVFMVVRHHAIDFASGALVFPGGKVDAGDAHPAWAELAPVDAETAARANVVAAARETFEEAGLVLAGTEVKSLRVGKASLQESWATLEDGEVWVHQMHIPPYEMGNRWNLDPVRKRKLLLHRSEIDKLWKSIEQKGHTLIPLKLYFIRGRAKLLIGVAKGRKSHDKREAIATREAKREMDRAHRHQGRD